jgi:hypothetical protein
VPVDRADAFEMSPDVMIGTSEAELHRPLERRATIPSQQSSARVLSTLFAYRSYRNYVVLGCFFLHTSSKNTKGLKDLFFLISTSWTP